MELMDSVDSEKLCEVSKATVARQYNSVLTNNATGALKDLASLAGRASSGQSENCTEDTGMKPPFHEMLRGQCLLYDVAEEDENVDEYENESHDNEDGNDCVEGGEKEVDDSENDSDTAKQDDYDNVVDYDEYFGVEDEDDYGDEDYDTANEYQGDYDEVVDYDEFYNDEDDVSDEDYDDV
jgi:hypothetical protein